MEQTGEVVAVSGEELVISFCRPTDCEKCGACHGAKRQTQLTLKGRAKVGDLAVVDMPSGNIIKAAMLAYGVPLIGLIAGLGLGYALGGGDLQAFAGGLLGLGLALVGVRLADRKIKNNAAWHPQLIRVLSANEEERTHA